MNKENQKLNSTKNRDNIISSGKKILDGKSNSINSKGELITGANSDLDPDSILIAEFQYIQDSAKQANEDRLRIFEFSIANILTFILGVFSISYIDNDFKQLISIPFLLLFLFGIFSLFKLARLRKAWVESAKALNKIKTYYINNSRSDLASAFTFKDDTLPKLNKKNSVGYFMALTLIVFNSVSMSFATYLLINSNMFLVYFTFLFISAIQLVLWEFVLTKQS